MAVDVALILHRVSAEDTRQNLFFAVYSLVYARQSHAAITAPSTAGGLSTCLAYLPCSYSLPSVTRFLRCVAFFAVCIVSCLPCTLSSPCVLVKVTVLVSLLCVLFSKHTAKNLFDVFRGLRHTAKKLEHSNAQFSRSARSSGVVILYHLSSCSQAHV